MLARNLDGAPAGDELPIVAEVMIDDLREMGIGDADAPRVAAALNRLGRTSERWPKVVQVRQAMPPRDGAAVLQLPNYTRGERDLGSRHVAAMLDSLGVVREARRIETERTRAEQAGQVEERRGA